jgi:hypothetical protein
MERSEPSQPSNGGASSFGPDRAVARRAAFASATVMIAEAFHQMALRSFKTCLAGQRVPRARAQTEAVKRIESSTA